MGSQANAYCPQTAGSMFQAKHSGAQWITLNEIHRIDERGLIASAGYWEYLETNRERLPPGVQEFIFCDWFHNPRDPRCPHDAWLQALTIRELSSGERSKNRLLEITGRFLGAYHDGFFEMIYLGVKSYAMNGAEVDANGVLRGHGDWLASEITVENGGVSHEILFSPSSRWIIRCEDIHYRWMPK
jgi:hypothetical protein